MGSFDSSHLSLLLGDTLSNEGIVFCFLLLLVLNTAALKRAQVTATLKTDGGDQTLDLGPTKEWDKEYNQVRNENVRLGVGLSILLLLTLHFSPNNVFPNIVLLAEVEESPDLGRPLGTKSFRKDIIGESWNIIVALLDDDQGENGDIGTNDAAANWLALALTSATGSVAGVTIGKEESDTVGEEDTLFHGETLLVVSTSDTEDVAFPLVTERVARDFLCDFLVVEDTARKSMIDIIEARKK
jgi:hypothetical protein